MKEQFVKNFMAKIDGVISDEDLRIVYQQLEIFVSDYEISPKKAEVVLYEGYLPQCYQIYFVTRKIEGMSMKSLEQYELVLRDFFYQTNKRIEEITANDIRIYLYKIQQQRNIGNRTLNGRRIIIHAFMEWASNEGYIGSNPCRNVRPIKYEEKQRLPLSAIELEMVREACKTIKDKAIVELLYSTGCRVTEMERLDITDVDFQRKEVYLFGKGNKHRTSFLNAKAELSLRRYLATRNDGNPALFVSDRRPYKRLKKEAIERRVKQLGEESGINRRLYPHLIRHTMATDGLDRGMPVEEIQQILGHVDISTTMIYAKALQANTKNDHRKCIL